MGRGHLIVIGDPSLQNRRVRSLTIVRMVPARHGACTPWCLHAMVPARHAVPGAVTLASPAVCCAVVLHAVHRLLLAIAAAPTATRPVPLLNCYATVVPGEIPVYSHAHISASHSDA